MNPLHFRLLTGIWLLIGFTAFIIGITAPMMTLTKLIWFDNTFTVLSGIGALLADQTFALGMLIMAFSVIFPAVKFIVMTAYVLLYPPLPRAWYNGSMHWVKQRNFPCWMYLSSPSCSWS